MIHTNNHNNGVRMGIANQIFATLAFHGLMVTNTDNHNKYKQPFHVNFEPDVKTHFYHLRKLSNL